MRAQLVLALASAFVTLCRGDAMYESCSLLKLCPESHGEGPTSAAFKKIGSDKFHLHGYFRYYDFVLAGLFGKKVEILEIVKDAQSLDIWKDLFAPESRVIGMAYSPEKKAAGAAATIGSPSWHGTHVLFGDQSDCHELSHVAAALTGADIIIDDGTHVPSHQLRTFLTLFPRVKPGGFYIIEDTLTSYWDKPKGTIYGYTLEEAGMDRPGNIIAYFKLLVESLHMSFAVASHEHTTFETLFGGNIDPAVSFVFFGKDFIAVRKAYESEGRHFYRNPEDADAINSPGFRTVGQAYKEFLATDKVQALRQHIERAKCVPHVHTVKDPPADAAHTHADSGAASHQDPASAATVNEVDLLGDEFFVNRRMLKERGRGAEA